MRCQRLIKGRYRVVLNVSKSERFKGSRVPRGQRLRCHGAGLSRPGARLITRGQGFQISPVWSKQNIEPDLQIIGESKQCPFGNTEFLRGLGKG